MQDIELNKRIGKNIFCFRERKGIERKAFATYLGIHISYVTKIEKGYNRPPLEKLILLRKLFNCTLDELVD